KLGIGIPFYGYQWTGGGVTAPYQHWTSNPSINQTNYNSFAASLSSGTYGWDSTAHVPYISGSHSFLTSDNEQSITDKINYVKSSGLGGWIIWNISTDYMPGQNPAHPLLTAVKNALGNSNNATPPSITSASPMAAGTMGSAYSQAVAASGTTPLTWSITGGGPPSRL